MENARVASLKILNIYFSNKNTSLTLKKIINDFFKKNNFSEQDKRLIYNIVKGTVKFLYLIDYTIKIFSNIKIEKINFEVLNLLRLSIYQLFFLKKIAHYAVLNEGVEITKKISGVHTAKFVNAVLRKISSIDNLYDYISKHLNDNVKNNTLKLSILHSFPLWLIEYWNKNFSLNKIEKLCKSLNDETYNFIRVNRCKISKEQLLNNTELKNVIDPIYLPEFSQIHTLIDEDKKNKNSFPKFILNLIKMKEKLLEDVLVLKSTQGLKELCCFKNGYFSINDLSSQIAVKFFLNPGENEKILDLCGAPGGKATYIAELTNNKCEIVSVDISEKRLNLFKENISRLQLNNITLVNSDISENNFLEKISFFKQKLNFNNYFDKILIDPPCSAFGTISKNPDVKYNKSYEDVIRLSELSFKMLNNCIKYLKPKGKILFYTCTISCIENQNVINNFLKLNKFNFKIAKLKQDEDDYFEIMPYYFKSEAGFIAILEKTL